MAATESCTSELEIEIPWSEVEQESDKVLEGLTKDVRVPGFRKGKAPKSVLKLRYREEIKGEVLDKLLPKHFWDRAQADNLQVVGPPDVTDVKFEDNEPVVFKAVFEVYPEFELGTYRRLEVPFIEPVVVDEDIDRELESLRERNVSYVNLDPRPLEEGDMAVVSLKSEEVDGAPAIDQEETTLTIGADETLPDFSDALRGRSPEDEVDFEVNYPDDFGNEKLAGKAIKFHAKIQGLRKKELPALDDDFAKDVDAQFETLDQLKTRIREGMQEMRRNQAAQAAKDKLVEQLVDAHEFPVPGRLVDQRIKTRLENNLRSLSQQGLDIEKLDLDWAKIGESERPRAERDVRAGLLLERIADVENIEAADTEMDAEIERYAEQNQLTAAGAREKLTEDGTIDNMKSYFRNEKVLNFLFDEAEKVDPPEEEPEEPSQETASDETAAEDSAAEDPAAE